MTAIRVTTLGPCAALAIAAMAGPSAVAQTTASAPAATTPAPAEQATVSVEQRNAAIADFQAAQAALTSGDGATAIAKLTPDLATLRAMAAAEPANAQTQGFVASAFTMLGNAHGRSGDLPGARNAFEEALPYWKAARGDAPSDANIRNGYTTTLVNVGNLGLAAKDKAGAQPAFEAVAAVAEPVYASTPGDAVNANALLSSYIGLNNITRSPDMFKKLKALAQAMNKAGTISAANKPAVAPLLNG